MSVFAIRSEGLSKKFKIGAQHNPTLRGTLSSLIKPKHAHKDFWALDDLNFNIEKGKAVGIIGRNGSGKSTLLKILSRITHPTKGKAIIDGSISSLLEVGTGFHPELTGRENIFLNGSLLGMSKQDIKSSFDSIVSFSEIDKFIDTPVKRYSSGMYVRLAFSVAAHLRSDILLIDEVLAVGDTEFQNKCLGKMDDVIDQGKTILFVSHDLNAVDKLCESAIHLDNGKIKDYGNTKEVINSYLSSSALSKKKYSGHSNVLEVRVIDEIDLVIELDYHIKEDEKPDFGFIVTNSFGEKIFGANPTISNQKVKGYLQKGTVSVEVKSPNLILGNYFLSVWFNNGTRNTLVDENCIKFNISRNSKFKKLGFIKPEVNYKYC